MRKPQKQALRSSSLLHLGLLLLGLLLLGLRLPGLPCLVLLQDLRLPKDLLPHFHQDQDLLQVN